MKNKKANITFWFFGLLFVAMLIAIALVKGFAWLKSMGHFG